MGAIVDKLRGKAKQIEGKLTGDELRVAQGTALESKGDIEGAASRVVRKVKRTVRRVKSRAKAELAPADRGTRIR